MKRKIRMRSPFSKAVAGICGVARFADKARAVHTGDLGTHKYGTASEQDTEVLAFLGLSVETFQAAAVKMPDDTRLGAWVLEQCGKSAREIAAFNRGFRARRENIGVGDPFSKRRRELHAKPDDRWLFWLSPSVWAAISMYKLFKR